MNNQIAARFAGEQGQRHLVEAWARQPIVGGEDSLARALSEKTHVDVYAANQEIIQQDDADTDFYLILLGAVQIEVNGRPGPIRGAGAHLGEMSLIDVHVRRSATARALEETVVARISEQEFSEIARNHPRLWRYLAIEIAARLRQRLRDIPPKNNRPYVFIGSSSEGLTVAQAVKAGISRANADIRIWTEGIFGASETNIESLERAIRGSDLAVLVLSPDDKARSRGKMQVAPRDNVIFELGLFMGALGRSRVFVVAPRSGLKVPTDLLGMTHLVYDDDPANLERQVTSACDQLVEAISRLGPK